MRRVFEAFRELIPEEYRKIGFLNGYLPLIIAGGLVLLVLFLKSITGGANQTMVHISAKENFKEGSLSTGGDSKASLKANPSISDFSNAESSKTVSKISVQVAGYVSTPGVFEVKAGSRVIDVIRLANPQKNACLDALNLARKVSDGERIYVPSYEEVKKAGWPGILLNQLVLSGQENVISGSSKGNSASFGVKKFDINTCTKEELISIPGIGEKTAEKIISYREKKGGFKSVEELLEVPGIGEKKLDALKDYFFVTR